MEEFSFPAMSNTCTLANFKPSSSQSSSSSSLWQIGKNSRESGLTVSPLTNPPLLHPLAHPLPHLPPSFCERTHRESGLTGYQPWRISSRVFHHQQEEEDEQEQEEEERRLEVHSMCEGLSPNRLEIECASCQGEELEFVDRMDCLWEDFNNEEKDVHHVRVAKNIGNEICVLQGSKPRRVTTRRKPSSGMLMVGKLLRRLLSLRNKSAHFNT